MPLSSHEVINHMVTGLLTSRGQAPELLLQHLIAIQQA